MGQINPSIQLKKWMTILLGTTIFGSILLPPIYFSSDLPAFDLSDITFPFLFVLTVLFLRKESFSFLKINKPIVLSLTILVGLMVLSIFWNQRFSQLRDWFEVLKILKFGFFILVSVICFTSQQLKSLFTYLFLGVLAFNLLHYFDLFQFNSIIEPYYSPAHHLDFFGKNSLGEPATKRALGTLGNPNTNGLLFLLFILVFLPRQQTIRTNPGFFLFLAIIGLFMCQSRTGTLAYLTIIVFYFLTMKSQWRTTLIILGMTLFSFLLLQWMGNFYLDTLTNPEVMQRVGRGRLEQWTKIIESMPGYWLLGHGPNKAYFESHGIYSESEYFLFLFRYGLIGLVSFLSFWWIWLRNYVFNNNLRFRLGLFLLITYIIGAITNNPLQSPKIALLLGVIMALAILESNEHKKETA